MHLFAEGQPDLNWENPAVRDEVADLMRFWLDKGVDGFRMDVIAFISKDHAFPDYPPEHRARPEFYHADGPRLHEHLAALKRDVLAPHGAVTIGEAFGVTFEQACLLTDARRGELDMLIHFDAVRIDRGEGWRWRAWTLPEWKAVFAAADAAMGPETWRTVCLSNHDNPRLVSHFGDDAEPWRVPSAKLLATLLMTQKGTPFVYQGDELGHDQLSLRGPRALRRHRGAQRLGGRGGDRAGDGGDLPLAPEPDRPRPRADAGAVGRDRPRRLHHRTAVVRPAPRARPG